LSEWILLSGTTKSTYKPTPAEIGITKAKILERFKATEEIGLTLEEVSILKEEILVL
jgi:hypothetical protein